MPQCTALGRERWQNMTKLFLIEGLPCSGKSTTSRYVARKLEEMGKTVRFCDEGKGNHPADFEFHAWLDGRTLETLDAGLREKVLQQGLKGAEGYIVPLSAFSGREFETLLQYKIYDFLPWEAEKPRMLEKWKEFAEQAAREDAVSVFNCVFLQNPMCETMMRFDFPKEESFSYISQIHEIIRPLNPRVIYLQNEDIAASVLLAAKEREGWLEGVIDYHVRGGYGTRTGAEGFEGYIACLEERQRRELECLKILGIPSLILSNPQKNWPLAYQQIDHTLE